eukprot:2678769-Heterocapsa_arctica.AAC.1
MPISRSTPVPLSTHMDASTLQKMGIHPQQPPQDKNADSDSLHASVLRGWPQAPLTMAGS